MSALDNNPLVCTYTAAGFTVSFPTETETLGIEQRPHPDSSGRTVIYTDYLIHLKSTIAAANQQAGQPTDATLAQMRKTLSAYGGQLSYSGQGFGPLNVNVPGGPFDAVWGPKPEILKWKALGANQAAEVEWQVRVRVPECPTPTYKFALMEFCYKVEFGTDTSGYQTRRYVAHFSIPQTRATPATRTLTDSADALNRYFEQLVPALVYGFRRTVGPRTVSEDKCRVDFTITDTQVGPNYLPPGVVEASLEHSGSTVGPFGGQGEGSFSGTYEMALDADFYGAFQAFVAVVQDRLQRTLKAGATVNGKRVPSIPRIVKLGFRENNLYGKKVASFTANYLFFMGLNDILATSGMWVPVPGNDWNRWSTSLANTAFHPRGNARLSVEAADDAIIDLCQQAKPGNITAKQVTPGQSRIVSTLKQTYPDPAFSWIDYVCWLVIRITDEVAEIKPLPGGTPPSPGPGGTLPPGGPVPTPGGGGNPLLPGGGGFGPVPGGPAVPRSANPNAPGRVPPAGGGATAPDSGSTNASDNPALNLYQGQAGNASVVQQRTTPRWEALLYGWARRAGFPVVPAALVKVGNQTPIPANDARKGDGWGCALTESYFGVPVYSAYWQLRYILPDVPAGTIPVVTNPFAGF